MEMQKDDSVEAATATSSMSTAAPAPSTSSLLHRRRQYREATKTDLITKQQKNERKEQVEKKEVEDEQLEGEPSSLASGLPLSSSSSPPSSDRLIHLRPGHAYNQLPVDLVLLIAQYLDGRSLARLGSCDRTSQAASQKSQLWEYLTQHTELQAKWLDLTTIFPIGLTMRSVMRREMLTYLNPDPSSKFVPVRTAQSIYQTRYQIACRLRHYAQAICTLKSNEHYAHGRVRTMRMIEEVIVPPSIVLLAGWQLVNLALALDSPDAAAAAAAAAAATAAAAAAATAAAAAELCVTIYTLVPLCLIYAILLASMINLFYVRWRHSFVMNLTKLMSSYFTPTSSNSPDNSLYHASSVDTSWRFLPESYFSSSRSMMRQLLVRITPINHSREMEMMRHLILIVICMMPAIWLCLMQLITITSLQAFVCYQLYIMVAFGLIVSLHLHSPYPRLIPGSTGAFDFSFLMSIACLAIAVNIYNLFSDTLTSWSWFSFHIICIPAHVFHLTLLLLLSQIHFSHNFSIWYNLTAYFLVFVGETSMFLTLGRLAKKMDGHLYVKVMSFSGGIFELRTWWNVLYPLIVPLVWMLYLAVRSSYTSNDRLQQEDHTWMIHRGRRAEELFIHIFAFNDETIEVKRSERHEE